MADEDEFLEAVKRGDAPAVSDLLRNRPALARFADELGKTGLHWAAETDQADVARVLLDAGADIEARTSWGATPLDWAATLGSGRVADELLSRGASGFTLIVAAALGKREDVVSMLAPGNNLEAHRRRGAPDSATADWPGDTAHVQGDVLSDALHGAARNGHTQVVEYLADRGAAIDAKGFFGATGLHWAAINGHRDTVRLLVARGANVAILDAHFKATAEDWANEGGHADIAHALNERSGQ